jgi:hypothetical protein
MPSFVQLQETTVERLCGEPFVRPSFDAEPAARSSEILLLDMACQVIPSEHHGLTPAKLYLHACLSFNDTSFGKSSKPEPSSKPASQLSRLTRIFELIGNKASKLIDLRQNSGSLGPVRVEG